MINFYPIISIVSVNIIEFVSQIKNNFFEEYDKTILIPLQIIILILTVVKLIYDIKIKSKKVKK
jgi:hypothetical protein